MENNVNINNKFMQNLPFFAIPLLLVFLLISASFYKVPVGHKGVEIRFGAVTGNVYNEGWGLKIPLITNVKNIPVRIVLGRALNTAISRDLQTVQADISINYSLEESKVDSIFKTLGDHEMVWQRIIAPNLQETVKAVTAQFSADELITKRSMVSQNISTSIKERVESYGVNIKNINIEDFRFSDTFTESVEAKVRAEQDALRAQNELKKVQFEAEQKLTQAKAEAEGLRIQRSAISEQVLKLREIEAKKAAIEKWDGKLPNYMLGDTVPFLDLKK